MKTIFDRNILEKPTFYPYEDCEGNEITLLELELELAFKEIDDLRAELKDARLKMAGMRKTIKSLRGK